MRIMIFLMMGVYIFIMYYAIKNSKKRGGTVIGTTKLNYGTKRTVLVNQKTKKEDDKILHTYIEHTILKLGKNPYCETIEVTKRRMILSLIFSVITLLNMLQLFFYHNLYFLNIIIELLALVVFIKIMANVNMKNIIGKKIKASPDNNMEYIIAQELENAKDINFIVKYSNIAVILIFIIVPLFIFSKPHIIYEDQGSSYAVRYYTLAINNDENVTIPSTYNNKPVTSIRGSVFSNLDCIKTVYIPDTVTEIRGEAFKNCKKLKSIRLSQNIKEIKGNTFENDSSLQSIEIPEGVTRIGGHAFYGCSLLSYVSLPSTLLEIGSSAFRMCGNLYSIQIPSSTYVNQKAFKQSPTRIIYK